MANPRRGEHEVKIGSEQYRLRLTFNSVAEAERYFMPGPDGEAGVFAVLERLARGRLLFSDLRALLWAALRGAARGNGQARVQTIDEAGDLLETDIGALRDVALSLSGALADLFPLIEADGGEGGQGNSAAPRGQTSSG